MFVVVQDGKNRSWDAIRGCELVLHVDPNTTLVRPKRTGEFGCKHYHHHRDEK